MAEAPATAKKPREFRPWPLNGGRVIARVLADHGIKHVFGIEGGHVYAFEAAWKEMGIQRLHMRHEQAAAYAADAYGRASRSPGVCYATAGPGATNLISGICQAYQARGPLLALVGHHPRNQNILGSFQEAYPVPMLQPMCKWAEFVHRWADLPMYVRKALRDCMLCPPGPVVLAMDPWTLNQPGKESELVGNVPLKQKPPPIPPAGDPDAVERAVAMLLKAERPIIVAGDGVYWSGASQELRELAELLQVPVSTRRLGRGAVPEDHPLSVHGSWRGQFWAETDLMLLIGMKLSNLEGYGMPPQWPEAKRVVIHESPEDAWSPNPVEMEIIGSPRTVLKQLIGCAKGLMKGTPQRRAWLEHLQQVRSKFEALSEESIQEMKDWKPVHPFVLSREIVNFLDDSATVIFDSYTGSAHLTAQLKAKFAGSVLDTGEWGGVGHGIGMGIGAQVARPGKQVLVMMGDAGVGIGGMDIETAVRYKLPIVYLVYNNSTWMAGCEITYFKGQIDPWGMLPDIGYERMFEVLGCHAELVTEHSQIRPALERAFNSGKTAVINIIVDNRVPTPGHLAGPYRRNMHTSHVDPMKIPDETYDLVIKGYTPEVAEELRKKGWPLLQLKGKITRHDLAERREKGEKKH